MNKLDYDVILFDLDGTLTDSAEGIVKSVQYAVTEFGRDKPDTSELGIFVGPPLATMFKEHFGLSTEDTAKALDIYRMRYADIGWKENLVYDGVEHMLKSLKDKGKKLAICTSKLYVYAVKIAEYFGISQYMDFVAGSSWDDSINTKAKVIEYCMTNMNITDRDRVIMVGDRFHDIEGSKEVGIKCIGVTYGYGSAQELKEYGADYIVSSPKEVNDMF